MSPTDAHGMANSVDPDQTAAPGAHFTPNCHTYYFVIQNETFWLCHMEGRKGHNSVLLFYL